MWISKNQNLKPKKKRKGKGKGKSIHIRPPLLCRNPTCYRWGMVVTFLNAHKGLTTHNRKFWLTMHVFLPLAHASNGGLSKFPPWHRRQDSTNYLRVLTWHPVALYRPLYYRSHINIQHHALQIQNLPYRIVYSLSVPPVTHNSSPPYQWQVDMVMHNLGRCSWVKLSSHHTTC